MKMVLMSFGSRGDIQPFIALGLALQKRGHSVNLAAPSDFEAQAKAYDIPFTSIPLSMQEFLGNYFADKELSPMTIYHLLRDAIPELRRRLYQTTEIVAELARDADLLLAHALLMPFAYSLHQSLNIPLVLSTAVPVARTKQFSAPMLPALPFAQDVYNPQTYALLLRLMYSYMLAPMNQYRQEIGLPKEKMAHLLRLVWEEFPLLLHFSRHIVPRPPDWGATIHVHGQWSLPAATDWMPPEALRKFLAEGDAPIYFGFGSMPVPKPEIFVRNLSAALRETGKRGLLQAGWAGLHYEAEHLTTIGDAPHDWLFPRMAAIVHHGGAGTTHSAVMAGKASLIVPFYVDQAFWGRRLAELGVALPPIALKKLTKERLLNVIHKLSEDEGMRQRAEEMGALLRAEDGLGATCEFIERTVTSRRSDE